MKIPARIVMWNNSHNTGSNVAVEFAHNLICRPTTIPVTSHQNDVPQWPRNMIIEVKLGSHIGSQAMQNIQCEVILCRVPTADALCYRLKTIEPLSHTVVPVNESFLSITHIT